MEWFEEKLAREEVERSTVRTALNRQKEVGALPGFHNGASGLVDERDA